MRGSLAGMQVVIVGDDVEIVPRHRNVREPDDGRADGKQVPHDLGVRLAVQELKGPVERLLDALVALRGDSGGKSA